MSMEALEKVKHEIAKAEDRIRYYEQQDKIMRSEIRRLTRKERTHRLCTRGGLVEHFILEPDLLTDADVYILLSALFESEETQEKLKALIEHRKEVNERNASENPCAIIHHVAANYIFFASLWRQESSFISLRLLLPTKS